MQDSSYWGAVELGDTLNAWFTTDSSDVPTDADSTPTVRVYGDSGFLLAGTVSQTVTTFTVTNATNASPIVITTAAAHNLASGMRVTISGVGGNTAANTTAVVTVTGATTFSIPVAGNGAYTSGGSGHPSGLYSVSLVLTSGNGFESGKTFHGLITFAISSTTKGKLFSLMVT